MRTLKSNLLQLAKSIFTGEYLINQKRANMCDLLTCIFIVGIETKDMETNSGK